jgi:hypothetical protein
MLPWQRKHRNYYDIPRALNNTCIKFIYIIMKYQPHIYIFSTCYIVAFLKCSFHTFTACDIKIFINDLFQYRMQHDIHVLPHRWSWQRKHRNYYDIPRALNNTCIKFIYIIMKYQPLYVSILAQVQHAIAMFVNTL